MKKLFLSFSMAMLSLGMFAHGGEYAGDANPNITPYHDAADAIAGYSKAHLLQQQAWKSFVQKYPTWGANFNRYTQLPHRALGEPITFAPGGNDAVAKAKAFIQSELAGFNIPLNELEITRHYNDGKFIHVDFKQVHNNMDVMWSRIYIRFTQDLKIVLVGTDAYRNIPTLNAAISPATAILKAEQALVTPIVSSSVDADLKIFPLPVDGEMTFRPVYKVHVETQDDKTTPGNYTSYVDAIDGTILYRDNAVKHIDQKVKAELYPTNLFAPSVELPLSSARVKVGATSYFTDANGNVTLPGGGPVNVDVSLDGKYVRMLTGANGNTTPSYSFTWNNNNDSVTLAAGLTDNTIRHFTAYYHINLVHDFMKSKFPNFNKYDSAWSASQSVPLLARIDRTDGNCNAFYNGSSVNFYTTANGCNALSLVSDVMYHEYGHGITNRFWNWQGSSFDNGAVGEGYSDVWAASITKSPVIGPGFYVNQPGSSIRRYDINPKVYPYDIQGEVHADGEIIAGAWYDFAVNLSAAMPFSNAVDTMSDLFSLSHYGLANGPDGTEGQVYYDILIDALQYDDDNANINDGTPHFLPIVQAFAKHGIYLLSTADVNHTSQGTYVANSPITINANAVVDYPAFLGDVKMFYRLKGSNTLDSLLMTKTGLNLTANFPSSVMGEIYEYYFSIYDNANIPNTASPKNAAFNITVSKRNLPHYLIIGYNNVYFENFDAITASTPGWTVGNVTGDNATAGKWAIGNPIASMTNGDTVQTGMDHTTGSGKCAYTANAATANSAVGSADVDGGRTSMITAPMDISTYVQPVISYWRWFTNSQGTNPGKDWWRVYVSYDGTNWTLIERTFAPDPSWRRGILQVNKGLGTQVQLMFVATDSAQTGMTGSIVEAAIDDIQILDLGNPTSVNDLSTLQASIFPNPAKNQLQIITPENGKLTYSLMNTIGDVLVRNTIQYNANSGVEVNTSSIANGIYFVKLEINGKNSIHKIVISK